MARKAPDQDAGEALRRFKSDLKAGTLGNFYIISGEEAFLRSHYVDLITKKIADGRVQLPPLLRRRLHAPGPGRRHRRHADDGRADARARGRRRSIQTAGGRARAVRRHFLRPARLLLRAVRLRHGGVQDQRHDEKARRRHPRARADPHVRQAVGARSVRVDHAAFPCPRQDGHGRSVPVPHFPHRRPHDHARRGDRQDRRLPAGPGHHARGHRRGRHPGAQRPDLRYQRRRRQGGF